MSVCVCSDTAEMLRRGLRGLAPCAAHPTVSAGEGGSTVPLNSPALEGAIRAAVGAPAAGSTEHDDTDWS